MRAVPVKIATCTIKTLSFRTDHLDKQCKRLRSACSSGISLIRVYTVAIPSAHSRRNDSKATLGPAVLSAGTGWKLIDFGVFFFNSNGVFGQERKR